MLVIINVNTILLVLLDARFQYGTAGDQSRLTFSFGTRFVDYMNFFGDKGSDMGNIVCSLCKQLVPNVHRETIRYGLNKALTSGKRIRIHTATHDLDIAGGKERQARPA